MNALKLSLKVLIVLSSVLISNLSLAAPLSVSGTVKSQNPVPANLRVGVFLTDRSGNPTKEISSSAITNGSYNLSLASQRLAESGSGLTRLAWLDRQN
jgi:hypothetical protein